MSIAGLHLRLCPLLFGPLSVRLLVHILRALYLLVYHLFLFGRYAFVRLSVWLSASLSVFVTTPAYTFA